MKCVAEILAIRECAEVAYQIEQKRLDEQAKQDYTKRIKETINFCETKVNNALIEKAKARHENIFYELKCVIMKDRLNNEIIIPLEREIPSPYANGQDSWCPSDTEKYDYKTFIHYLTQFCYKIEEKSGWYARYGFGNNAGITIRVYI